MEYWHNNRCRKSREALAILNDLGVKPNVKEYLKFPPSVDELKTVIDLLGISPIELIRKNESIFKEQFKGKVLTDDQWIEAMVEFPKLIERPILIANGKAIVARPPELVREFLE